MLLFVAGFSATSVSQNFSYLGVSNVATLQVFGEMQQQTLSQNSPFALSPSSKYPLTPPQQGLSRHCRKGPGLCMDQILPTYYTIQQRWHCCARRCFANSLQRSLPWAKLPVSRRGMEKARGQWTCSYGDQEAFTQGEEAKSQERIN